jgi:hypothetical protein
MNEISIQPIDWPQVTVGKQTFTLRLSYAAYYQAAKWQTTTDIELAAAAAGSFDREGHWHSAGFKTSLGFVDLISEQPVEEQIELTAAVNGALADCVKKARLRPVNSTPAVTEPQVA